MNYLVNIGARKVGAIGAMYVIKRTYPIEAQDREQVHALAIKRAYEDGDIEHVRVESVTREIEAHDLELYAINTGQFYETHKSLADKPLGVWVQHVATAVKPRYCREIEPVFISPVILDQVAQSLKAYYVQHMKEMD